MAIDLSTRSISIIVNVSGMDLQTLEAEAERKGISVDSVVAHVLAKGALQIRKGANYGNR